MMKVKTLTILTIVLGAMLPGSFVLSLLFEDMLILGVYCGLTAIFSGLSIIDAKKGRRLKLIPIGSVMIMYGFIFLGALSGESLFITMVSIFYILAGIAALITGIVNHFVCRKSQGKKPLNNKIYLGIGLLAGGFISAVILFNILPFLMVLGHLTSVSGFILLMIGITQQRKNKPEVQINNNTTVGVQSNNTVINREYCARCGMILGDVSREIDGKKYCVLCKEAIDKDKKSLHKHCKLCGVDLPAEYMHVIDGNLLCHSCFLKKFVNIDYHDNTNTESEYDTMNNRM